MTDAHNHLQQLSDPGQAILTASNHGVTRHIVNGTSEADWPQVHALAQTHPQIIPAFGLHPWHLSERSPQWLDTLRQYLISTPQSGLGECGLDRWKKPFHLPEQIDCLQAQIKLAHELQRPLTIHCLQAWGPLLTLLQAQSSLPPFLLHAYSGSTEMIPAFTKLGAYFSFNGYFLHERKASTRQTFQHIPSHRLLLETDAPAMLPPAEYQTIPLSRKQNHPANLTNFLDPLAKLYATPPNLLANQMEANCQRFLSYQI